MRIRVWRRRKTAPEKPSQDHDMKVRELDARLEDAGRQLAESKVRAVQSRQIADESARLVARNSITRLVRDSIINHP